MPTGVYPRTEYHRNINRLGHLGQRVSKRTRKKLSGINSGRGNSFYGRKHKPESKQKMRHSYILLRRADRKIRASAHHKVLWAKKRGRLIPQPCCVCGGTEKIHAHHEDYSKPLDVIWVCTKHHNPTFHKRTTKKEVVK